MSDDVVEVEEDDGIKKIDGPSDEELLQVLYRTKSSRVEQLEVENARLQFVIQKLLGEE